MATYVFETMTAAHAASYDPSEDVVIFGGALARTEARPSDVLIVGAGDDTISFSGDRRSAPAPRKGPDTSPAGLERLRQAELRRKRRADRQKKGMSHG